jgi:hypothetical protein
MATVIWLACAVPLYGGLYACSVWLTPEPFKTAAECSRALAYLQYHEGHHDEYCAELERGGWCAFEYDPRLGNGSLLLAVTEIDRHASTFSPQLHEMIPFP